MYNGINTNNGVIMKARGDWHLKYRPFQLDEMVGQGTLVETLKQASRIDRFANS